MGQKLWVISLRGKETSSDRVLENLDEAARSKKKEAFRRKKRGERLSETRGKG